MMGFDLIRPGWLALCAAALIPLFLGVVSMRARIRGLRALAEPRHLGRLFPSIQGSSAPGGASENVESFLQRLRKRGWLRIALGSVAVLLIAISLLGPVRGFALVPVKEKQIDVVVALDTSRSMLVEDVAPSRLGRAKSEISALLDVMQGERVGLVGFAGSAREVAPLTRDLDTARYFLDRMSPDDNRKGGTSLAAAIRLAVDRFDEATGSNEAIILVTDGEDLTGEGLSAAERAAAKGIKVHVLGLGTELGGKVPDEAGGFVVDPESADRSEVISKLSPDSLRAIADASGGIYLQAKGRVLPLEELYRRAIVPMEGREVIDGKEKVPRDRFQWPLGLALLALLIEAGLTDRPRRRPKRSAKRAPSAAAPTEALP